MFGWACQILGGTGGKFRLKWRNISFFQGLRREYFKWSLNSWEALDFIFFDQKFPSAIRI